VARRRQHHDEQPEKLHAEAGAGSQPTQLALDLDRGVFWQQAEEGSIEELSRHIAQVFNYLYGLAPSGLLFPDGVTPGSFYSCPTNAPILLFPACDILLQ